MKGVKRLPYRLSGLLKALAEGEPILLVEGEKCADSLHGWGYTATTNSEGAGKWKPALNRFFPKEAKIYLIPDADQPGVDHMEMVGKYLLSRGCQLFWIDLGFKENSGKDIADWIPSHNKDDLETEIAFAPRFELDEAEEEKPPADMKMKKIEPQYLLPYVPPTGLVRQVLSLAYDS
ncbi:hypothetical protein ES708_21148 [subsurface metagenome]